MSEDIGKRSLKILYSELNGWFQWDLEQKYGHYGHCLYKRFPWEQGPYWGQNRGHSCYILVKNLSALLENLSEKELTGNGLLWKRKFKNILGSMQAVVRLLLLCLARFWVRTSIQKVKETDLENVPHDKRKSTFKVENKNALVVRD